jgi:hypothetical protein
VASLTVRCSTTASEPGPGYAVFQDSSASAAAGVVVNPPWHMSSAVGPTGLHNRIAIAQAGTYDKVEVCLFERRMDIGGRSPADFADASLMRLAHCRVKVNRQTHFIDAQAEIWNPGMMQARGMCGGVFAQSGGGEFLVLSMWASLTDHERYLSERFSSLRQLSGAEDDLDGIAGDLVELEPAWTVLSGH